VVFLIASARKKWGLYYQEPNNGGKMWEEMFIYVRRIYGWGIVPSPNLD
jgi:hypothetical protein